MTTIEQADGPEHARRAAHCPGCGAVAEAPVYSAASMPVTCASVFDSASQAQAVPVAPVELVSCRHCGLLFNSCFDASLGEVGARYESSQAASAHFSNFARWLAHSWVDRYRLAGKSVLEIGCGRGEFLRLLLEEGVAQANGLDPLAPPQGINEPRLKIEPLGFSIDTIDRDAEAVVCRHTLEHVADVQGFLRLLAQWASRAPGRLVLFEVPATERVLEEAAFWDVYYEHCNYFTAESLAHAFESAGFEVTSQDRVYGDQYLILEARLANRPVPPKRYDFEPLNQGCRQFGERAREAIANCERHLARYATSGRVVLWQGAAKTVGFLASLGTAAPIHSAVDLSPQRQGNFLPGSGLAIHPPSALTVIDPRYIIVMNPVYREEVQRQLVSLGVSATLLTVNDICIADPSPPQSMTR